jgi:hypothetical protein
VKYHQHNSATVSGSLAEHVHDLEDANAAKAKLEQDLA